MTAVSLLLTESQARWLLENLKEQLNVLAWADDRHTDQEKRLHLEATVRTLEQQLKKGSWT